MVSPHFPSLEPLTKQLQQASRSAPNPLLELPTEILHMILQQIDDLPTFFALTQAAPRFFFLYDDSRPIFITSVTLLTLAARGIYLSNQVPFAEVAIQRGRQPSMYLQPAIRAICRSINSRPLELPVQFCRALLELVHFKGYQQRFGVTSGWKWELAADEGGMVPTTLESGWIYEYPCGQHNYHLLFIDDMSDHDVTMVRRQLLRDY